MLSNRCHILLEKILFRFLRVRFPVFVSPYFPRLLCAEIHHLPLQLRFPSPLHPRSRRLTPNKFLSGLVRSITDRLTDPESVDSEAA